MATYYPYLRAKQFEGFAVERAANTLVGNGKIQPIFEPVNVKTVALVRRAIGFAAANLSVGLVMNPSVGELVGSVASTAQLLADMRAKGATVIPALIVDNSTKAADLTAFAVHRQGGRGLYVHHGAPALTVITALASDTQVDHVFLDGATSAAHEGSFPTARRFRLSDGFKSKSKNASYPSKSFFTDLHLTHQGLGFKGFGDFTIVGRDYSEGGGPAYAVAIHITESMGAPHGVDCNHFLSTSNTTTNDPAGKFGEAVAALAAYSARFPGKINFSSACKELLTLHATGHFPGLGEVKRLAIQHHLELMATLV